MSAMRSRQPAAQALSNEEFRALVGAWQRYDAQLVIAVLALIGIGLVMVASSSLSIAARELGEPLYYFWRQAAYVVLGLLLMFAVTRTPLALWRGASPALLALGVVLLVLVLVPGVGRVVNGSARWLNVGSLSMQPSEFVKLFMILYLAGYLVRRAEKVRSTVGGFLRPVAMLALISVLLLLEPDYGATVVLFATALGMLFLGGVPFATFSVWLVVVSLSLGLVVLTAPYRV
ncbi:MAG: FtsW/RodA/SpoVE family cell cycle protein, partial [Gammaproteobacteria bacterium]|nr:FtsW/RodA/SpoVE family cell cycle protein [Gammaproteobacteria bacterium]